MDPTNRVRDEGDSSWLKALMQEAAIAQRDKDILGHQAPAAMLRLAKAIYPHDSSQSNTVAACLASVYNGSDVLPVRLDEIRWLDWALATASARTDLGGLRYLPCEQVSDFAMVMEGLWGRHRGVLNPEAIAAAIAMWSERATS